MNPVAVGALGVAAAIGAGVVTPAAQYGIYSLLERERQEDCDADAMDFNTKLVYGEAGAAVAGGAALAIAGIKNTAMSSAGRAAMIGGGAGAVAGTLAALPLGLFIAGWCF